MDYNETFYGKPRFERLYSVRHEYLITRKLTLNSDLPRGFTYTIWETDSGRVIARSIRQSSGSTRWYTFFNQSPGADRPAGVVAIDRAMQHGIAWAKRQRHSDNVVTCARDAGENTSLGWGALRDYLDLTSGGSLTTAAMDKACDLALAYRYAKRNCLI